MKRVIATGSLTLVLLAGCTGDERPFLEAVEVQRLGLQTLEIERPEGGPEAFSIGVGESLALGLGGGGSAVADIDIDAADRNWRVADPGVLGVTRNGVITGLADGVTQLSVSIGGVESTSLDVEVTSGALESIESIVGDESPDVCSASRYAAIGSFAGGTTRLLSEVEWLPGAGASLRMVEPDDLATGAIRLVPTVPGESSLTARVGEVELARSLQVPGNLQGLSLPSALQTLRVGGTVQLTATASYDDDGVARPADVTDGVEWSVLAGDAVTIGNTGRVRGLVEAQRTGDATVQAGCGAVTAQARVGVSGSDPDGDGDGLFIQQGAALSLSVGGPSVQLRVFTGPDFDDDREVTDEVQFSSDNVNVATVATTGVDIGRVTPGLISGVVRIRADFDGRSDFIDVTVR